MKKITVSSAGGDFAPKDEPIAEPNIGHARVKVQACGVCHSDALTREGTWPGILYPRVPGHEIAGVIDALGPDADPWKIGDRVGIGWHGGHCGKCESCRRGDFITCVKLQVPGISYDGGYAEYVSVPIEALARIPEALTPEEAAPLMCAGITTFNALRHSGARPGDLVESRASAVSAIWEFSSQTNSALPRSQSAEENKIRSSHWNWELEFTLTRDRRMSLKN